MKKPKIKKTDFLTIPEAPNYEINGLLKVRNKTTGKLLKGWIEKKSKARHVFLTFKYKKYRGRIFRVDGLYQKALAAWNRRDWYPIPMLGDRYELNYDWQVRNAKTGQILKPTIAYGNLHYFFRINGKLKNFLLSTLVNNAFRTGIKRKKRRVGVRIQREGKAYFFYSLRACGKFLANHVAYTPDVIKNKLCKRPKELFGWLIKYF